MFFVCHTVLVSSVLLMLKKISCCLSNLLYLNSLLLKWCAIAAILSAILLHKVRPGEEPDTCLPSSPLS